MQNIESDYVKSMYFCLFIYMAPLFGTRGRQRLPGTIVIVTLPPPLFWYAVFVFFNMSTVRKVLIRSTQKSCYCVRRPQDLQINVAILNKKHNKWDT